MAEKFRFFDSQVGDVREYNAAEFAEYFETLIDTGLIVDALNELNPTVTGTNMIVTVDTGNAFINGRWYENDSSLNKTFDTESIPNDRIDLLVLRLDLNTNERKITFEIVKGTPSTTPVAPTLTRTSVIYELGLAEVAITGGQSFIAPGDLTDLREITTDDPFSFPTASSKVVAPQTATNTTDITALKRSETFLTLTEIGISDSSLSTTDFGANVLTILNALPESTTFDDFLGGNLGQSIDNELGLSVGAYRLTINSNSNDNNIPNTIQIIPNNITDFYIGTYDNTFLGVERVLKADDLHVVGTYTGNGSASRFINLGFTPSAVHLNESRGFVADEDSVNNNQYRGGLAVTGGDLTFSGNGILDVTTNGFNVYFNNVDADNFIKTNENGINFRYIAFR